MLDKLVSSESQIVLVASVAQKVCQLSSLVMYPCKRLPGLARVGGRTAPRNPRGSVPPADCSDLAGQVALTSATTEPPVAVGLRLPCAQPCTTVCLQRKATELVVMWWFSASNCMVCMCIPDHWHRNHLVQDAALQHGMHHVGPCCTTTCAMMACHAMMIMWGHMAVYDLHALQNRTRLMVRLLARLLSGAAV